MAVGGERGLVDASGHLDLDMVLVGERRGDPGALAVGEQVGSGVQGPARLVERVALEAAVPAGVLLDAAPAPVQGVTGQASDVERVMPTSA